MPILPKKSSFQMKLIDVNNQNCRIWGTENPHAYSEKPIHPKRVTAWCGFWSRDIIGPFFFENSQGVAVTVNGDRYRTMLNEFLFTKIEEEHIGNICYWIVFWTISNSSKSNKVQSDHSQHWVAEYRHVDSKCQPKDNSISCKFVHLNHKTTNILLAN